MCALNNSNRRRVVELIRQEFQIRGRRRIYSSGVARSKHTDRGTVGRIQSGDNDRENMRSVFPREGEIYSRGINGRKHV